MPGPPPRQDCGRPEAPRAWTGAGNAPVNDRFARQCRYRKLVLWTQSELKAARRVYEQVGFRRTGSERHASWGRDDLVAGTWELDL
jgi:hypothetical protein